MAKLSVAVLFLFFTLSLARDVTHLKLPSENDVIRPELPNTLPESEDSVTTVSLPSKSDDEETRSVHPVPLTLVRFRPINRRFPLRSNLPFRLCHHHFHHLKPGSRRQIPFGNDMILSSKRNIDFDKFVYRVGVRQIPSDRFNFHHDHYDDKQIWKFLYDRERFGEMKLEDQSPHHHHHHHHDANHEDDDHEQKKISEFLDRSKVGEIKSKNQNQFYAHHVDDDDEADKRSKLYAKHYEMKSRKRFHYDDGEEEKAKEEKWHKGETKKGGFMRGIRKFLHHYFD